MTDPAILTRRIAFAVVCLLLAAGLGTYALMQSAPRKTFSGEALVGGPFTMVNHNGQTVTEKTFLGKPMLVFFGFTTCPDICPTELQVMTAALDELGEAGRDIQPIFVTIDPARDTPEVIKPYVEAFSPRLTGLTGTADQVQAMANTYRVYFAKIDNKDVPEAYLMDHSSHIYLMGHDGKFLKHFTYTTDAKALAQGVRTALTP